MIDSSKIDLELGDIADSDNNSKGSTPVIGAITQQIGRGDDAKHSIIWVTIKYCFWTAGIITTLLSIGLIIAYSLQVKELIESLQKFILSLWSIFTPIITLALGYAFGKDKS